ncbi:hypothetical protein R3P38DRAFT_1224702 [Favolaschia claudopus]|uniref:Uncharacterized protein n=1 Tax=Favolaschia claudopus TaxID=2862362 RepID=A0AAW0B1W8_9AGAR
MQRISATTKFALALRLRPPSHFPSLPSRTLVISSLYRLRPILHVPSRRRFNSTSPESSTFTDPNRPDLHYHLVNPPTPLSKDAPAFALSFVAESPSRSTVLGWLPAATTGEDHEAGLNDFVENPEFRTLLHQAIQDGLREKVDDVQIGGAIQLGNGWMHIHDERNVPALGRIGDPDDIIATVLVEDGEIRAETYQAMPSYRICTADGPTQLTPGLAQKLKTILHGQDRAKAKSESG